MYPRFSRHSKCLSKKAVLSGAQTFAITLWKPGDAQRAAAGPVCPLGHPSGPSSGSYAASDAVRGRSGSRGEREHGALCRNNAVPQHLDAPMLEGRGTVCAEPGGRSELVVEERDEDFNETKNFY